MATRDTIVIGASAGGVQALTKLVSELPANLPAAVLIVLHVPSNVPSLLPEILARGANVPVAHATDQELISHGKVYVAPPDHHLIIENGRTRLVHGPKENLHRPSIDTLFRSAARWAGPRVIGVVLTGARDDGKLGMRAVKQRGGITVVQDPREAPFPSMPMSVMQEIRVDYSLSLVEIAPLLSELSRETVEEEEDIPCRTRSKLSRESRGGAAHCSPTCRTIVCEKAHGPNLQRKTLVWRRVFRHNSGKASWNCAS